MGVQHFCPDLLLVWLKDRCIFIGDQSEFNCEGSCLAYETTVLPLHRGPNVGKYRTQLHAIMNSGTTKLYR